MCQALSRHRATWDGAMCQALSRRDVPGTFRSNNVPGTFQSNNVPGTSAASNSPSGTPISSQFPLSQRRYAQSSDHISLTRQGSFRADP